jgi:hypothetical protein
LEKEKINNIEDFNPVVEHKIIRNKDFIRVGSMTSTKKAAKYRKTQDYPYSDDFMDISNFNYLRPIRNTFSFFNKKRAFVDDFIKDLKVVSSPSFGIDTKRLDITSKASTVIIVISGNDEDVALWHKNVNKLYEFYKSL